MSQRSIRIGRREIRSGLFGSLFALLTLSLVLLLPAQLTVMLTQPAIDGIATLRAPTVSREVTVVDIDSISLESFEGRRLSRRRLADLVIRIKASGASVIAFDLVLEGPCDSTEPGMSELVQAVESAATTSGFLLTQEPSDAPPVRSPIALDAEARYPDVWRAAGAETSCPPLLEASDGLATLSLFGDPDALVRSAPAVITVAERPYPSLAVDAVRLHQKTGAIFLLGNPPRVRIGSQEAPLDSGANALLRFSTLAQQKARTIAAAQVLDGTFDPNRISGKIVFIGSSAAELGGLRPVPGDPLKPSVQIHADFASNLLLGTALTNPPWARIATVIDAAFFGIFFAFVAAMIRPPLALVTGLLAIGGWLTACAVSYHGWNVVLDPVLPVLTMVSGAFASSAVQFAAVRRGEAVIRQRFEQRLPAAVVRQLVNEPTLLKLRGEQRIATSMFTDIEGFTTTTEQVTPVQLIDMLDSYFEGLTGIIIAHGGMIDKTTGDGIHALFNAPVDLEAHAEAAISCAREIIAFSETYRHAGLAAEKRLGRTRIGIESGSVVLGDVGGSGRVDYAAFGSSINTAARLQEANKRFGTSILVGPGARAEVSQVELLEVSEIELRGIGMVRAYTVPDIGNDTA